MFIPVAENLILPDKLCMCLILQLTASDRMPLTFLHFATFLLALQLTWTNPTKQSSKPHIIFIVADDLVSHTELLPLITA